MKITENFIKQAETDWIEQSLKNGKPDYNYDKVKEHWNEMEEYKKIEQEFFRRKYLKVLQMEYTLGENLPPHFERLKKMEDTLKEKIQIKTAKENKNGFAFITINPHPLVKFHDFKKFIDKLTTKTCFSQVIYVYEQRGTNLPTLGDGFHSHILVKRNLRYKPSKLRDNVLNSVKRSKMVKNLPHGFDYKIIGDDFARDKLDYILGLKTGTKADGTKKSVAQIMDKIWRNNENLSPYYGEIII